MRRSSRLARSSGVKPERRRAENASSARSGPPCSPGLVDSLRGARQPVLCSQHDAVYALMAKGRSVPRGKSASGAETRSANCGLLRLRISYCLASAATSLRAHYLMNDEARSKEALIEELEAVRR